MALFILLMAGWIGARVALWEHPAALHTPFPGVHAASQTLRPAHHLQVTALARPMTLVAQSQDDAVAKDQRAARRDDARSGHRLARGPALDKVPRPRSLSSRLWYAPDGRFAGAGEESPPPAPAGFTPISPAPAASDLAPLPDNAQTRMPDRWSIDAWAFWRQGSDGAPISQGRVPIYGASQAGAIGQFRLAPASRHDPRLYVRGYRALVTSGEAEMSLGLSARPLGDLPVRTFAEIRYTDALLGNEWRPSVFAVTELPPQILPGRLQFEAYGQAGWVGGKLATPFADGQLTVTREMAVLAASGRSPVRFSIGAGAWGGAQQGANRVDAGPTMRIEWRMGTVPARLNIDWRERVSGDAAPGSGLAATLSTSF